MAPGWNYPQELRGCASATKNITELAAHVKARDFEYSSTLDARAIIAKACTKQLGAWTWQNGQFVRDTTAKH